MQLRSSSSGGVDILTHCCLYVAIGVCGEDHVTLEREPGFVHLIILDIIRISWCNVNLDRALGSG